MKLQTLLLLTLLPLTGWAQQNLKCLSRSDADAFFKDFKVFEWSGAKKGYKRLHTISNFCTPEALTNRLVATIKFMDTLNKNQNPKSASIVVREGAGNYFRKRISRIAIEDNNDSNCRSGVLAYVYRREKDVMHICPGGVESFESPLALSRVLIHEARHTEGFTHVHCTHGMYRKSDTDTAGSGSCDETYEAQGSYGVAASFMVEIAKSSLDPAIQQHARSSFVVDVIQRFNKLPLDIKVGMVAQTTAGGISFYDGKTRQNLTQLASQDTVMTSRLDLPTFFDPRGSVKSYAFSQHLIETQGGYAKDYVTDYTPAMRNSLKDVYYGTLHDYSCLLFEQTLRCGDNFASVPDIDVPLNDIRPIQFLMSDNSKYINGETLYISAEDGYLYSLPAKFSEFKTWAAAGKFTPSSKAYKWKSLVSFDNGQTEYAVDFQGNLEQWSPGNLFWKRVKPYKDDELKKLISPFYWSKKLEGL